MNARACRHGKPSTRLLPVPRQVGASFRPQTGTQTPSKRRSSQPEARPAQTNIHTHAPVSTRKGAAPAPPSRTSLGTNPPAPEPVDAATSATAATGCRRPTASNTGGPSSSVVQGYEERWVVRLGSVQAPALLRAGLGLETAQFNSPFPTHPPTHPHKHTHSCLGKAAALALSDLLHLVRCRAG